MSARIVSTRLRAIDACAAWAALAIAAANPAWASGSTTEIDARYDAAHVQYEVGHYQVAFDEFAALADGGHCGAARIARLMVREGRALYALVFTVAPERLERWARLSGCAAAAAAQR